MPELKPGGIKQRMSPGEWEKMTNRQQRRLTKVYDAWSVKTRRALVNLARSGGSIPDQYALFERATRELEIKIKEVYNKGIDIAKNAAAGSRADLPEVKSLADDRKRLGAMTIAAALIPTLTTKLVSDIARGAASNAKQLANAFLGARSLAPQYAGGAWVMIFETQKVVGKNKERERKAQGLEPEPIRWVLDPRADHCEASAGFFGCPQLEGEYKNWDALPTVPAGQVACRGNCRCHLEVFRDGKWQRGVYDD